MKTIFRRGFRGFAFALAAGGMAGCVVDDYTGPAISLTGGYENWSIGVTLMGRQPKPPPNALEQTAELLSATGHRPDAKQPISDK